MLRSSRQQAGCSRQKAVSSRKSKVESQKFRRGGLGARPFLLAGTFRVRRLCRRFGPGGALPSYNSSSRAAEKQGGSRASALHTNVLPAVGARASSGIYPARSPPRSGGAGPSNSTNPATGELTPYSCFLSARQTRLKSDRFSLPLTEVSPCSRTAAPPSTFCSSQCASHIDPILCPRKRQIQS
jgi:hypothetical protein